MTHPELVETAESLLTKAERLPIHSEARAAYVREAGVRAQLALVRLVEAVSAPPEPAAVEPDDAPESPAPKRRRSTKKPTEAAE